MMQREVQVTISAVLAGWLLGLGSAAGVQAAEPAAAASAEPKGPAEPAAAKASGAANSATTPASPATTPASPATTPGKPGPTALPPGTSIKVERTASGIKLFRITEGLLVEGQMQRPNAFLVLQRATVDYDYEALSESFLPRIVAATREKPF
jgi:hypothetical protein